MIRLARLPVRSIALCIMAGSVAQSAEAQTNAGTPASGARVAAAPSVGTRLGGTPDAGPRVATRPPAGTRLGGLGRRPLGGPGSTRIEDKRVPARATTPALKPAKPSSFRAIADEIDRSSDPS